MLVMLKLLYSISNGFMSPLVLGAYFIDNLHSHMQNNTSGGQYQSSDIQQINNLFKFCCLDVFFLQHGINASGLWSYHDHFIDLGMWATIDRNLAFS